MDEGSGDSAREDEAEENQVISTNRWLVLAETDDGYGLWLRGAARSSPPFATFGQDAEGFTDASREFRRRTSQIWLNAQLVPLLSWNVVVGVIVWVVCDSIFALWNASRFTSTEIGSVPSLPFWVQGLGQVAYALWVGSLGVMVMLWLLRRSREDAAPVA